MIVKNKQVLVAQRKRDTRPALNIEELSPDVHEGEDRETEGTPDTLLSPPHTSMNFTSTIQCCLEGLVCRDWEEGCRLL